MIRGASWRSVEPSAERNGHAQPLIASSWACTELASRTTVRTPIEYLARFERFIIFLQFMLLFDSQFSPQMTILALRSVALPVHLDRIPNCCEIAITLIPRSWGSHRITALSGELEGSLSPLVRR